MRRTLLALTVAGTAALAVAFAPTAQAAVNIDPATGTGFVGKGDVQLAFGWNNTQLQANASKVLFSYEATADYAFTCEWTSNDGKKNTKQHTNRKTATEAVATTVSYETRTKNAQVTGFTLGGIPGGVPEVAQPTDADCGAEGSEKKTIVSGSVEVTDSTAGFYVLYGGQRELIQQA